jgi:hypothetical protein
MGFWLGRGGAHCTDTRAACLVGATVCSRWADSGFAEREAEYHNSARFLSARSAPTISVVEDESGFSMRELAKVTS